jgi:hypothetical protein
MSITDQFMRTAPQLGFEAMDPEKRQSLLVTTQKPITRGMLAGSAILEKDTLV